MAVSTFFIAKVFSDYNPDSKAKWVYYGVASVATGYTAYLRLKGGQHFPSDILLGVAMGTFSGILVPKFHKIKNRTPGFLPYINGEAKGFTLIYKFQNGYRKHLWE